MIVIWNQPAFPLGFHKQRLLWQQFFKNTKSIQDAGCPIPRRNLQAWTLTLFFWDVFDCFWDDNANNINNIQNKNVSSKRRLVHPPQCFFLWRKASGHLVPSGSSLSLHLEMLGFLDLTEVVFREGEGHPSDFLTPHHQFGGGVVGLYPHWLLLLLSFLWKMDMWSWKNLESLDPFAFSICWVL